MDVHEAHARSRAEFEQRLNQITAADWDRPTACGDWTVRDLVTHLVGGDQLTLVVLEGGTAEEGMAAIEGAELGDDPIGAFAAAADAVDAGFRVPGALERTVHHPAGEVSAAQLHGFRVGDYAIHAWDLARAIDADDTLDPEIVAYLWEALEPVAPFIGDLGIFGEGPSGNVAEDAPLQDRLIDLTGRRG